MALFQENLDSDDFSVMRKNSVTTSTTSTEVAEDGQEGMVMRYQDAQVIKDHIQNVISTFGTNLVFRGIENLKAASIPEEVDGKPKLRRGQIIFGTVSIAHHQETEDTWGGTIANFFAPILTLITTGQARQYAYLHSAVYAGEYNGKHYVIENGGALCDEGIGMINAVTFEDAFEADAEFFVLSPPKDSNGKSTRYMVLQRALASCGLYYKYHMRAVSCEVFAMTMKNCQPVFEPLQTDVIKPSKGHEITEEKRQQDEERYHEFFRSLQQRLSRMENLVILTLKYYLESIDPKIHLSVSTDFSWLNSNITPWFEQMKNDYDLFFQAVLDREADECESLIEKGLDVNAKHFWKGQRFSALELAIHNGSHSMIAFLEDDLGATRD